MNGTLSFEDQVFARGTVVSIFGGSLGDEGKSKVVSLFHNVDRVATPTGGGNAGHTVYYQGKKIALHELPGGAIIDSARIYLGQGRVINIADLWTEMTQLQDAGISLYHKIVIAGNAHLVFANLQRSLDGYIESIKSNKVGTTNKGIGPAYALKAFRTSITVNMLLNSPEITQELITTNLQLFPSIDQLLLIKEVEQTRELLISLINQGYIEIDTDCMLLHHEWKLGKRILIESSQSALLSIDGGMYPYCTSSDTSANGIASGLNLPHINTSIAVFKSIKSKVGGGYFPTEFEDQNQAKAYRDSTGEYGATTGRPRQIGRFDCVETRKVLATNQVDVICITKADVLSHLDSVKYACSYKINDCEYHNTIPHSIDNHYSISVERSKSYKLKEDMSNVQNPDALSTSYKEYFEDLLKELNRTGPVLLGTGPDRDDICILQ